MIAKGGAEPRQEASKMESKGNLIADQGCLSTDKRDFAKHKVLNPRHKQFE
jgi:hypothetical protein